MCELYEMIVINIGDLMVKMELAEPEIADL